MAHALQIVARAADRGLSLVIVIAAGVSGTAIFVMAVLMAVNVIARQVFNRPFLDTVLLGELSVVVLTYMGLAWVYRRGAHVSVSLLVDRLSRKTRLWVEVFGLSLSLVGIAVAIYETWAFAYAALQVGERLRGMFRVDAFPFQVLMPIGLALLSLEIVRTIVLDLVALMEAKPERSESSPGPDLQG